MRSGGLGREGRDETALGRVWRAVWKEGCRMVEGPVSQGSRRMWYGGVVGRVRRKVVSSLSFWIVRDIVLIGLSISWLLPGEGGALSGCYGSRPFGVFAETKEHRMGAEECHYEMKSGKGGRKGMRIKERVNVYPQSCR